MIEQQYYTRERGGLFSQTDGYDTVAKSPQLKLDYIKKNLHPLCSYDIPAQLQKIGEQDESKYPPNFMIVPLESGETIVGQAVYKSKDFTGQRSTFFMHNFILSESERRRYVKEPEKLFGITDFKDSYDIEEGRELPTLAAIYYEMAPLFHNRGQLLAELGIKEEIFYKLVAAVFMAVNSKRKIFIVLDVPIEKLGMYAKALLYHLYTVLPWAISEKLGVSTYSNKLEARKNIHITFIEREILQNDSRSSKGYIFDFANNHFTWQDEDVLQGTYINLAMKYTSNKLAWEKYNKLADELGETLEKPEDRDIKFYGWVILFFEMHLYLKGRRYFELTSAWRKDLLKTLMSYTKADLSDDTLTQILELIEYTIGLIHEPISHGVLWTEEEIKALLQYKLKVYEGSNEQYIDCEQICLCLLNEAVKEKKYTYVDALIKQIRSYPSFYQGLYAAIYNDQLLRKEILHRQLEIGFEKVKRFEELVNEMAIWEIIEDTIINDGYYSEIVTTKFMQVIEKHHSKVEILKETQQWTRRHKGVLYSDLRSIIEEYFLSHINIDVEIASESELCSLRFEQLYPLENYDIITTYQSLKTDITTMNPNNIKVKAPVQELVKKFYQQTPSTRGFYMLVYAFLNQNESWEKPKLQFNKVLNYLYNLDKNLMYEFIVWSKNQEVYIDKGRFDLEVLDFFAQLREKKIKISKEEINQKLRSKDKTKVLAEKLIEAQKPTLSIIIFENLTKIMLAGVGAIVIGSIGGICVFKNQKEQQKALQETFKSQTISETSVKALTKYFSCETVDVEKILEENFDSNGQKLEKEEQEEE